MRTTYGEFKDLKEKLLFKKITAWDEGTLTLDDGTKITIECSEYDCCASAGGSFSNVVLDAVITDVVIGEETSDCSYDTTTNEVTVKVFHNQNPIAQANCYADDGNGGYYYSVCSLVVKGVHYSVVSA